MLLRAASFRRVRSASELAASVQFSCVCGAGTAHRGEVLPASCQFSWISESEKANRTLYTLESCQGPPSVRADAGAFAESHPSTFD